MKTKILAPLFILLFVFSNILLFAWGSWGHKHINRAAVFALPEEMQAFYYNHIDFITEGAVVPDLRRGLLNDKAEAPRHYVDIEDFPNTTVDQLPRTWKEATLKYDSLFLVKTGFLPWYIQTLTDKLTTAFKRRSKSDIIFISAELGHYVGDAHMPLHTSSNHDGQLTNQKGIHALWESTIPPMFGGGYNFNTGDAKYINDITAETWRIIKATHSLADSVLAIDRQTRLSFPKEEMYKKDDSGKLVLRFNQPVFSDKYAQKLNDAMNGMVEKQLRLSIADVANYWYTAWVNGGKPDLLSLDDPHLTEQNKKNFKKEMKAWQKGKLLNLEVKVED